MGTDNIKEMPDWDEACRTYERMLRAWRHSTRWTSTEAILGEYLKQFDEEDRVVAALGISLVKWHPDYFEKDHKDVVALCGVCACVKFCRRCPLRRKAGMCNAGSRAKVYERIRKTYSRLYRKRQRERADD